MRIFDLFRKTKKQGNQPADGKEARWESAYETVKRLGIAGYQMQYFDICRDIWKTKVPKSGQADTLQGEMLRQAEKLRNEARDNGNINWDENYSWFCDFLKETFEHSGAFDKAHLEKLAALLTALKRSGEYAAAFHAGRIAEEDVEAERIAYTENDLYDYLEDGIAFFAQKETRDIPYQKKDFIHR